MSKRTIHVVTCLLATVICVGTPTAASEVEPKPNDALPRVLLIGDSICGGYQNVVRRELAGKAVVVKNAGNAQYTGTGLEKIDQWLGDGRWDVIHFNWGLWDMYGWQFAKEDRTPPTYEKRLDTLVTRLKKTNAKLIWGTTTPACPGPEWTMSVRFQSETHITRDIERQYQDAARRVMEKHGVAINDLHALMLPELEKYATGPDNVHFNGAGCERLGKQVAEKILEQLTTPDASKQPVTKQAIGTRWPRFRGADGSGHVSTDLPVEWNADDIVWRTELVGRGQSSPCIWDDKIFLTSARKTEGDRIERLVLCLDRRTGELLWQESAHVGSAETNHAMNTFATPTCACDGQRVAAFFGRGGLHGFDRSGKKLWSRDLGEFPGPWGTAASPILLGDMVIQNCDAQGRSFIIAVHKDTGETIWQTDRGEMPRGGWSTPIVIDAGSRKELILNGEYGVTGYDPATGGKLWFCKGFNGRGTPSPVFDGRLLYIITAKPGDTFALKPGGSGDVTDSHMAWHSPRPGGRNLSSPALVGDYLLTVTMSGIATCYMASDGDSLWTERLDGGVTASPLVAGGLFYLQIEKGRTLVIRPGKELDIVARNDLGDVDGEIFRATPAVADGRLFLRSDRALYCVERKAKED